MVNKTDDITVQDDLVAEKSPVKRTRKTKVEKATGVETAVKVNNQNLFGFEPYQEKPGEMYMSDAQLEHFKNILTAWKNELLGEIDRTINTMKDETTALPDVNDRASQEEEFAIELRTRDRERKLIYKIDQSLQSIKDEDYGYCETCGVEIGLRRLEARPTATQCIDCKTLAEIKEKQNKG
ncbi:MULTISPECIES: RNA polymerase-binding protein DksA [unclassified Acinetobacter]